MKGDDMKKTYAEDFMRSVVSKALSNPNTTTRQIAKEVGIAPSTVYGWVRKYGGGIKGLKTARSASGDWTLEERFNMLLETANLSQEACSAYCRQRGIYQHQLTQWREAFMQPKIEAKHSQELAELKALRAENKALKKELNRKDKALAETSALLILKKKAAFLWGEEEED
jgi:transposase